MFQLRQISAVEVAMAGRLDAAECDAALKVLNEMADLRLIDCAQLDYIASAGLRVILLTQKRCKAAGGGIRLVNVAAPIHDIFHYAGFDRILDIERAVG